MKTPYFEYKNINQEKKECKFNAIFL